MSKSEPTWSHTDPTWYRLDAAKLKSFEDVVRLLDAINIKFTDTHPDFDRISDLLKDVK